MYITIPLHTDKADAMAWYRYTHQVDIIVAIIREIIKCGNL